MRVELGIMHRDRSLIREAGKRGTVIGGEVDAMVRKMKITPMIRWRDQWQTDAAE